MHKPIITIDGPAGAGKSSTARLLAERLGFAFLGTGSMYRAVVLLGVRKGVDWDKPEQLLQLARACQIDVSQDRTYLDGEDITDLVRPEEITQKVRFAADNPDIRQVMVQAQQRIAGQLLETHAGVVTEGRDQGTVVFPNAKCKIFLTASPEERARRRLGEIESRGETADFAEILHQINARDARDAAREVGPLVEPADAIRVVTDGMDLETVLNLLAKTYSAFE